MSPENENKEKNRGVKVQLLELNKKKNYVIEICYIIILIVIIVLKIVSAPAQ